MRLSGLGKARIAGLLRRPVEQRQVHVAVDDHPPGLFRIGQIAPRLDDLRLLVEAFQQGFRRQQREAARLATAGQPPVRHAGERIEEAEIVGVGVAAPGNAQAKRARVFLGHLTEFLVPAHLPRQPQLPGPEAGGPFDVIGQGVKPLFAGFCREFVTEFR